jgi:hypothetical protein
MPTASKTVSALVLSLLVVASPAWAAPIGAGVAKPAQRVTVLQKAKKITDKITARALGKVVVVTAAAAALVQATDAGIELATGHPAIAAARGAVAIGYGLFSHAFAMRVRNSPSDKAPEPAAPKIEK